MKKLFVMLSCVLLLAACGGGGSSGGGGTSASTTPTWTGKVNAAGYPDISGTYAFNLTLPLMVALVLFRL